jgi:hypothetical protein
MVGIARSQSTTRNPLMSELKRSKGEGNLAWGQRAAHEMRSAGPSDWTYVALIGAADTLAFRLRLAQSHLRIDMLPSYWSDAALVRLGDKLVANAVVTHVPLLQPEGGAYATENNGVVERPLADYDDAERYPNIALIALPIPQANIESRLKRFRRTRPTMDMLEHALRWLAFSWGVARTGNPLHENYGLPSAVMLETLCAAEGFDLTPGLESRASCPEAIWSAALHWHDYFKKTTGKDKVPLGRYAIDHSYPILELGRNETPASKGPVKGKKAGRKGA